MGVIIDTSGQIYAKLNAANSSLATLLSDAAALQTMGVAVSDQITAAQKSISDVLIQIEAETSAEAAEVAGMKATLDVMAPQLDAIYNLIVRAPVTIGIDVTGAVTAKQNVPSTHGP